MFVRSLVIAASLAFASAASAQTAPDWSTAQKITISMSNYAFTPATLQLRAGTPYHLVFTSTVTKDHNFASPELFAAGTIAPEDKAKVSDKGEVEVDDGGTVDVRFIPQKPGTYPFECTHFLHATMGMTGQVVVQ